MVTRAGCKELPFRDYRYQAKDKKGLILTIPYLKGLFQRVCIEILTSKQRLRSHLTK